MFLSDDHVEVTRNGEDLVITLPGAAATFEADFRERSASGKTVGLFTARGSIPVDRCDGTIVDAALAINAYIPKFRYTEKLWGSLPQKDAKGVTTKAEYASK